MIPYKQLSLTDIFEECQTFFNSDKHSFLALLENALDLDVLIPFSFKDHFYADTGRHRKYHLESFIWALVLQRIFSIPTDALLILFLNYSKELRDFCGFREVPDASKFTRFKQTFKMDLQGFFDHLVDLTELICQQIDAEKAAMTIFDTSGLEAYVTENNPKFANRMVSGLKAYAKTQGFDAAYDPYKAAYKNMPSHAASNPAIKQLYINGHFCYVYKFGMVTNGLGIVRDISFYNRDFLDQHPEITVEKKSDSPDEDKSLADSKALIPVLKDFFIKHPLINPQTFLGDAAFDSSVLYRDLLSRDAFGQDRQFSKAYIPLNKRSDLHYEDCPVNDDGIPCCPKDTTLPMKSEGRCRRKNGLVRFKFVCPKVKWQRIDGKQKRVCLCKHPCTDSSCGRMFYVYPEKAFRTYPGVLRGTEQWKATYKIRTTVERSIQHFKSTFCIAGRKTQNEDTLHADLLLAGITQLLTVLLADSIHQHQYIRSLKPLVA